MSTTTTPWITAIVAIDEYGRIGRDGKMLWRNKDDMAFFRSKTLFGTVVMGGTTFRSIGKPLEYRHNIVLSRDPRLKSYKQDTFTVDIIREPRELKKHVTTGPMYIIGGAEIYKMFLPLCSEIVVTYVKETDPTLSAQDVHMPPFEPEFIEYRRVENEWGLDVRSYYRGPSVEDRVINEIRSRQAAGVLKYGCTMARTDLSMHDWLQHAKEEMLDAAIYLQKLQDINAQLVKATGTKTHPPTN